MCSVLVVIGFFFSLWIVGTVIIRPDRTKNKREASLLNDSSLASRSVPAHLTWVTILSFFFIVLHRSSAHLIEVCFCYFFSWMLLY